MKETLQQRKGLILSLSISSLISVALVITRIIYTDKITLIFFIWNLFLAAIPFGISLLIDSFRKKRSVLFFGLLFIWLLFFPNAPYIVTDLFHLRPRSGVPFWFDLILFSSFAWNGMLLGHISLLLVHESISRFYNRSLAWMFSIASLLLSAFGVYLGRYLRWNSWDVVTNPFQLSLDIVDRFIHPMNYPRTWSFTIILSLFLVISYIALKQLTELRTSSKV